MVAQLSAHLLVQAPASTGAFTTLTTSGQATRATADINGGTADNVVIGGTTVAGSFTTVNRQSVLLVRHCNDGSRNWYQAGNVTGT